MDIAKSTIGPIFTLIKTLYERLEGMKANNKRCDELKGNLTFLKSAIQRVMEEDMKESLVQDALKNLERILKDAVKLVEKQENNNRLKQLFLVNSLTEEFNDINSRMSHARNDLCLSLNLEQGEQVKSLRKALSDSCRIEKDQEDMKADKQNWKRSEMGVGELGSADVPPPGQIEFVSVQPDSVSLRWSPPEGAPGHRTFKVTRTGGQKHCNLQVTDVALEVTGLTPGEKYHFTVATLSQDGRQSTPVEGAVCTAVPAPQNLQVNIRSLKATDVTWTKPAGVDQETYLLQIIKAGDQGVKRTVQSESYQYTITNLQTPADYTINITTVVSNGRQSKPASVNFSTEAPPPQNLQVDFTSPTASVTWTKPAGVDQVTYQLEIIKDGYQGNKRTIKTDSCQYTITDLQVDADYTISITTVLSNDHQSKPVSKTFSTAVPPPQNLQVDLRSLKATDVTWTKPAGVDQETYRLEIIKDGDQGVKRTVQSESCQYTITNLQTPADYTINITTVVSNGRQSDPASIEFSTEAPPPQNLQVDVTSPTASVTWTKPAGVDEATYQLEIIKDGYQGNKRTIKTDSCQYTIPGLQAGADYTISITSEVSNGRQSKPVSKTFRPAHHLALVLLGEFGSGKSASGNTILGEDKFASKATAEPLTTHCRKGKGDVCGIRVTVIDTPDFFDRDLEAPERHVKKCREMCEGQECVYLLVTQIGHFTEGERDILEKLEKKLGKIRDRTIILFTYGDDLNYNQSIDDYVRYTNPHLQKLIRECGNRYQVFNNRDRDEWRGQVGELMDQICRVNVEENKKGKEGQKGEKVYRVL